MDIAAPDHGAEGASAMNTQPGDPSQASPQPLALPSTGPLMQGIVMRDSPAMSVLPEGPGEVPPSTQAMPATKTPNQSTVLEGSGDAPPLPPASPLTDTTTTNTETFTAATDTAMTDTAMTETPAIETSATDTTAADAAVTDTAVTDTITTDAVAIEAAAANTAATHTAATDAAATDITPQAYTPAPGTPNINPPTGDSGEHSPFPSQFSVSPHTPRPSVETQILEGFSSQAGGVQGADHSAEAGRREGSPSLLESRPKKKQRSQSTDRNKDTEDDVNRREADVGREQQPAVAQSRVSSS